MKRDMRLVVSDAPIPGTSLTEAGVVRWIYDLAGKEGKSCFYIAEQLNQRGVPPAYIRDGRTVRHGKREHVTAGVWRAGRIRNLIVNTTYKGIHQFGKRSKSKRAIIERPVPAIVDEALWQKAQETLKRNFLFCARNGRRKYLLRGLVKCGLCGLTYVGTAYPYSHGRRPVFYLCNGKANGRGIYGKKGKKCRPRLSAGTSSRSSGGTSRASSGTRVRSSRRWRSG
jgi:site-specific DNA recombinase